MNPFDDLFIKDYFFDYDKTTKVMTFSISDISKSMARALEKNISLLLSMNGLRFYDIKIIKETFKAEVRYVPPEKAKQFSAFFEKLEPPSN